MPQSARKWLFRTGTLLVAGTLLYLGLRGVDFRTLSTDLQQGQYVWALPLFAVTLLSHLFRSIRWRFLLHALPGRDYRSHPIPVGRIFSSLMIGYMINYVAPRFGEIVRSSHLSIREKLTFSSVFGTVVAERLLDVLTLAVCLLTLPIMLGDRTMSLLNIVVRPVVDLLEGNLIEVLLVAGLVTLVVAAGAYLVFRRSATKGSLARFSSAIRAFRLGLLTLARSGRMPSLLFMTLVIWACYTVMAYIPFLIFGMAGPGGLTIADAWVMMLIGSVGVAIPSPGGVGSYHFLTIQALVLIWGVTQETAASYAIFTHIGQMLLYLVTGFAVVLIEGASWSKLKSASLEDATAAGIIDVSE